jgi:hypothetical protein
MEACDGSVHELGVMARVYLTPSFANESIAGVVFFA